MNNCVEIGNAKLYLGDCMDILPSLAGIEAIITDPPYGLGEKWSGGGGGKKTSWAFNPDEAKGWDGSTVDGVNRLPEFARDVIIWGGNYYPLPPQRCWLIWDKKQNDQWTTGQAEMAWTNLDRPIRVFRFAQCEQANEGPKFHPTQKPLALMKWCIKWTDAAIIADPFMGSGTTGVAAVKTGHKFIGIEAETKYFDFACRRVQGAINAPDMFVEPPKPAKQEAALEL